jgi:hypothetical protein
MQDTCLNQDIGLDQDGSMEVLIERGTPLPYEFSCQIQLNGNEQLFLYEGNHFETKDNHQLGIYTLENTIDKDGSFVFSLHISDQKEDLPNYLMKIFIDERLIDTVTCTQLQDDAPIEESRKFLNAKKEFLDYVNSTLLFLQDPLTQKHVPQWQWAIEKLEWAKQIVDYPVTTEEYGIALHEIEGMIYPLLEKTQHVIERTPL